MDSKFCRCCMGLMLESFLVLNFVLGGKENVRIRDSVAATICRSMKFYKKTGEVAGPLKSENHVKDGGLESKTIHGTCTYVKWSTCNNCPKFGWVPCNDPPTETNSRKESRIVGGRYARAHEFPFIVWLNYVPQFVPDALACGGSIYNKNWVITAAHCIRETFKDLVVVAGDTFRIVNESTEQTSKVEQVKVHEKYLDLSFDIALLKVSPSFNFNEFVQPIPIASESRTEGSCEEEEDEEEVSVRVSGWGATNQSIGEASLDLKVGEVKLISIDECTKINNFKKNMTEETICALAKTSELEGACNGDSGGPLFKTYKNGSWSLVGAVSGGVACGSSTSPSFYTGIAYFRDWIVQNAV